MSNSVRPYGLQANRLLCPGDSSGKKTRVSCHAFLQGIFPTQGLNPYLLPLMSLALADRFFTTSAIWKAPWSQISLFELSTIFNINFQGPRTLGLNLFFLRVDHGRLPHCLHPSTSTGKGGRLSRDPWWHLVEIPRSGGGTVISECALSLENGLLLGWGLF